MTNVGFPDSGMTTYRLFDGGSEAYQEEFSFQYFSLAVPVAPNEKRLGLL